MLDLNKEARRCLAISKKRQEHGGVDRDVLKHCAGEVLEAAEAREWLRATEGGRWPISGKKTTIEETCKLDENYAAELADVIICALIAAADESLDIEAALSKKIKQNEARAEGRGDKK